MVAAVNYLHLSKPTDSLREPLGKEGLALLWIQPDFRGFYFVKTAAWAR